MRRRGPQEPSTEGGGGDIDGCKRHRQHGAPREGACAALVLGRPGFKSPGLKGPCRALGAAAWGLSSQRTCLAGSQLSPAGCVSSTPRAKPLVGCGASCPPSGERAGSLGSEGLTPALRSASELSREALPQSCGGCLGDGTPDPSVSAHVHPGAQTGMSYAKIQPKAVFRGSRRPPCPSCANDARCRAGPLAGVLRGPRVSPRGSKPCRPPLQFQLALILI